MDEKLALSRDALVEALGRQSAFWGLGKTAGEIYAALYLGTEPRSLEEVASSLRVTKGNVSIAVRQLEQMGMVKRSWRTGDRRVFFEAETDFWKISRSFLSLRHKPEFDQSFALLEMSVKLAGEAPNSAEKEEVLKRLNSLQEFYLLLDRVVEAVLSISPEELGKLVEMISRIIIKESK
ncbi:MAG: GbsR/MarR family transcriptional regulator [Bacillota bacterium]